MGISRTAQCLIGEQPGPVVTPADDRYYVVLTEHSKHIHQQYQNMLKQIPHLYAAGRLADFRYYNMDESAKPSVGIN